MIHPLPIANAMETPLFSIITITFNAESTLRPTLESVAAQTYKGYEYLIIDGASRDATVELARQYPCVSHIVSEPDRGLYDAMNKGIAAANGEYLIFLNAGDSLYAPDTLQKIADFIGENRPDIIYGETAIVDSERRFISMRRLKAPEKLTWKSFRMGMLVCHQAFIARRRLAPPYDLTYRFSHQLPQRRGHHAQPQSLAQRALSHHGEILRPHTGHAAAPVVCRALLHHPPAGSTGIETTLIHRQAGKGRGKKEKNDNKTTLAPAYGSRRASKQWQDERRKTDGSPARQPPAPQNKPTTATTAKSLNRAAYNGPAPRARNAPRHSATWCGACGGNGSPRKIPTIFYRVFPPHGASSPRPSV